MRHISKAFAGVQALRDVSFACQKGEVHALVGENGAGKSTLMKILAGVHQADSGEIVYKGTTYRGFKPREALDKGISVIYQELALSPYLTVAENIFLGREPRYRGGIIKTQQLRQQAAAVLKRLGVPDIPLDIPVSELTVARQQMVEIAKALSRNADLIVMDEPSAILAGHELDQLFVTIESLKQQGVTIVYISHRLDEVFRVANQVTVLKDGEVVSSQPISQLNRAELVRLMVGRSMDEIYPKSKHQHGEPALVVDGILTDHLSEKVSFTLNKGETLGIAGMVGSGRTELARAIFGADKLTAGSIQIGGKKIVPRSPRHAIRSGIALVPEDRKGQGLFTALPIRNNISISILKLLSHLGIIDRKRENAVVEQSRRSLSINMANADLEVQFLSGGNQQKVVLAKWLETRPAVIILDEPTRGVDVGAKFEIYQIMRQLNDTGVAILMISSELPEVLGMSDRILVMRDGAVAGSFEGGAATEQAIIERATSQEAVV
ncbi:MAG: sugar ABC transporter ATP-binding protein [Anaerolineae bacterium]|nr:sugar ABC transporter ATP-binding protein [Anaerolineae bacterium]